MKSKFALVLACLSLLSFSTIGAANAIGSEYELSGSLEDAYKMFQYDRCPTSDSTYTPTKADLEKSDSTKATEPAATNDASSCCHNGGACKGAECKCPPGHCGAGHCHGGSCEQKLHKHKAKKKKPVILWNEKPPSRCPFIKGMKKLKRGVKHLFKK